MFNRLSKLIGVIFNISHEKRIFMKLDYFMGEENFFTKNQIDRILYVGMNDDRKIFSR